MSLLLLARRLAILSEKQHQYRQFTIRSTAIANIRLSETNLVSAGKKKTFTLSVREHRNFGHQEEKTPGFTKFFHAFLGTLFFISIIDYRKVKQFFLKKADADSRPDTIPMKEKLAKNGKGAEGSDVESGDDESEDGQVGERFKKEKNKGKIGFRDRKIIEYENRLRQFSTPDKIFRYFATIRLTSPTDSQVVMTPDDFLRSIYPGIQQPDGLGLDQYVRYDPKKSKKSVSESLDLHLEKNSIFYKLGSYGLITFSDYIFLLTVLSTSCRHFQIAFQMFDLNGDGDVDCEEFEKVATLARQQTSIGSRHRDHANTGNTFKFGIEDETESLKSEIRKWVIESSATSQSTSSAPSPAPGHFSFHGCLNKGVNSALTTYFFGKNSDQKLTIEKFLDFQQQLQREILSLEFTRKNPDENGHITEVDFAELLLAYAGYSAKKKQRKLKRVKRSFRENSKGISQKDYLDFFHFLNNINDVDTALTFYHIAGASIDQATLKHVAKTVAMVNLSDHVIDVVFTIFDDNNDNQLSNREFVAIMKNRLQRGLEKPKDTGFIKLMHSILKCAKETKPVLLDI